LDNTTLFPTMRVQLKQLPQRSRRAQGLQQRPAERRL
jgi:hypothetical protein